MRMILAVGALALLAAPTAGIAQVVTEMTPTPSRPRSQTRSTMAATSSRKASPASPRPTLASPSRPGGEEER